MSCIYDLLVNYYIYKNNENIRVRKWELYLLSAQVTQLWLSLCRVTPLKEGYLPGWSKISTGDCFFCLKRCEAESGYLESSESNLYRSFVSCNCNSIPVSCLKELLNIRHLVMLGLWLNYFKNISKIFS